MQPLAPDLKISITGDGSPTLAFDRGDGYSERMHHSGGAFGESLYIYGHALQIAQAQHLPWRVFSMGLGLGYNELIAIATWLKGEKSEPFKIWSYETHPQLRAGFRDWFRNDQQFALSEIIEAVAKPIAAHFQISTEELRSATAMAYEAGHLELRAAFPDESERPTRMRDVSVVFYDAFSAKMDDSLWQSETLASQLRPVLAEHAVLTTYAATGNLNRALRTLDFKIEKRPGFQFKRESTLASR